MLCISICLMSLRHPGSNLSHEMTYFDDMICYRHDILSGNLKGWVNIAQPWVKIYVQPVELFIVDPTVHILCCFKSYPTSTLPNIVYLVK